MFKINAWIKDGKDTIRFIRSHLANITEVIFCINEELGDREILEIHITKEI